MSDIEESRKEFKAWTKTFACPPRLYLSEGGTYVFSDAWFGWKAWQPARDQPASNELAAPVVTDEMVRRAESAYGEITGDCMGLVRRKAIELPKPDTHCIDEDTGKDVWSHSPEQMREYAAQVAAAENYGLLSLLYDIRVAAGDKGGKLMQDELVASIAALRADAERYRHIRLASSRDHAHHSRSCFSVGTCWWADSPAGVMPLRGPWSIQELTGAALDAAIDNARDAK